MEIKEKEKILELLDRTEEHWKKDWVSNFFNWGGKAPSCPLCDHYDVCRECICYKVFNQSCGFYVYQAKLYHSARIIFGKIEELRKAISEGIIPKGSRVKVIADLDNKFPPSLMGRYGTVICRLGGDYRVYFSNWGYKILNGKELKLIKNADGTNVEKNKV